MINLKRVPVRELCQISLFAAIIAVCAQIQIPQPGGVPFALQSWAVTLSGLVLGSKKGVIAVMVYITLGAAGAPVFAGFAGGLGVIMRHTGGFIVSFPLLAFFAGIKSKNGKYIIVTILVALGTVINMTVGFFWFVWVMEFSLPISFGFAVAPFILPETIKTIALPLISKKIKEALRKARVLL